jgi:hypothetical protein
MARFGWLPPSARSAYTLSTGPPAAAFALSSKTYLFRNTYLSFIIKVDWMRISTLAATGQSSEGFIFFRSRVEEFIANHVFFEDIPEGLPKTSRKVNSSNRYRNNLRNGN